MHPDTIRRLAEDKTLRDEDILENVRTLQREECKHNLWFLAKEVLGYRELGEIHKPLCALVESVNPLVFGLRDNMLSGDLKATNFKWLFNDMQEKHWAIKRSNGTEEPFFTFHENAKQRLFLMFRGSFKTTLITIAHTIQLMLIYPDIRILIASHKKEEGSAEILAAIKRHFMANRKLRDLFPEYCPVAQKTGSMEWGTTEKVNLPNRSHNIIWPEATIEIAGATTDVTGRHYDVIKADDLVTKDSVTNETMLQKTRQMFGLLKYLFVQPEWGLMDVVGTPYHFADLYATLRKSQKMTRVVIPATYPNGEPTFPERFSKGGIENIRTDVSMGSYEFSCQYSLNPVPTEDQIFRPEWWERPKFYWVPRDSGKDFPNCAMMPLHLKKYVFVDPASTRRKDSDFTALITVGVDHQGHWWLLDIIRDKLSPSERVRLALDICKKHDLHKIHYETNGFQDTDGFNLKNLAREEEWSLVIEEVKAAIQSKEDRIRGLQRMYEMGRVHWPRLYRYKSKYERRTVDMVELFRDEAFMFPKCEHDDMLDAHSQILQIIVSKAETISETKPDDEFEWWRTQAIEAKRPTRPNHRYTHPDAVRYQFPYRKSFPKHG